MTAVLHLDVDAFFASVEQRDDPQLRGRPVAVGAGVVASCSYEARRFGVRTGMRLLDARRLCSQLLVLPGEYPRYEQAARCILAVCQDYTPRVEVAALDDLYLDLAADDGPDRRAAILREQIRDEVRLSVSIGMGANKMVAKAATREAKPGGQVLVAAGDERTYLAPREVRILPNVGPRIEVRLDRLNVHRVGEVAGMPVPVLRGLFGNQGSRLHEQAHGIDRRAVEPRKPQQAVSRCTSFAPPVGDRAFLRAMLDYLVERAAVWMRFHDQATRGFQVVIRYGDYQSDRGRGTFRIPVDSERELKEAVRERWETLYQRRLPLRLLGIELTPLVPAEKQATLFRDADDERCERLTTCKDAIHERFGFTSLLSGSALLLARRLDRDRGNFKMRTGCLTR
ncbi:MAG TPA: DNA polymerase IV [Gemmataceae bacterium]|jgi:DNA polymerase-4|nr:DNA polymerase IV [Gemmataceae bacterium]